MDGLIQEQWPIECDAHVLHTIMQFDLLRKEIEMGRYPFLGELGSHLAQ